MTNIFSIIEERRSVRDFDPEQSISRDELMEILELAGRAPSAWNLQHWHFMVFHGKDVQKNYCQSQTTKHILLNHQP